VSKLLDSVKRLRTSKKGRDSGKGSGNTGIKSCSDSDSCVQEAVVGDQNQGTLESVGLRNIKRLDIVTGQYCNGAEWIH
jgi:hypothetical protein